MMRRLCPRRLGSFVQANAQRILLLLGLALLVLCAAINSVKLDADLSSWIQRTSRVDSELQAIESAIGDGAGTNSLLILQALKQQQQQQHQHQKRPQHHQHQHQQSNDILSVESLMIHLETLAIATHVTVDLFDVSWSLKDICFSPTLPDYEGMLVNQMLDHLMPCAIKTPLDCFWEGSKLLGPEQEVRLSSIGPKLRWTNLNPLLMIETKRQAQPHASFPYDALISWMKRTGISSGYLDRPCLDPSDPNCPASAPNKLTGAPNVGLELTDGCHGLAAKQMHWKEEELVGGVVRNKSGYIVRASALQSTIQLMGERDIYDYWRKTSKVQDINNWSTDKAKMVLETWQQRFKDELAQFTRTSVASSPYKIQALTPKSMLEPIDTSSILELSNFKLTLALFTLATCVMFPKFDFQHQQEHKLSEISNIEANQSNDKTAKLSGSHDEADQKEQISRLKLILLAILTSLIVILTFVASLGLSSFMNLPFNMITTQILPPLALYYGFRQALVIASTYAKHFTRVSQTADLTTECLNELLPILLFESIILILPLVVASALPLQATRVFCFQAVTYIVLSTVTLILLIPALLITVLMREHSSVYVAQDSANDSTICITYKSKNQRSRQPNAPTTVSIKAKKSVRGGADINNGQPTLEELIFSRLQEDLRYIRADKQQQPSNIDFSAQFKLTTTSRSQVHNQRNTTPVNVIPNYITQLSDNNQPNDEEFLNPDLPDLLQWTASHNKARVFNDETNTSDNLSVSENHHQEPEGQQIETEISTKNEQVPKGLIHRYSNFLANNQYVQAIVCLFSLAMLVAIMPQSASVKCGLQMRDIVLRGTIDYDSLMIREKYFPVYNTFIITQDDFDYAANQMLLYELHRRVAQIDGVIGSNEKGNGNEAERSKFWLMYFRDWLLELQDSFDTDRNRSAISREGWSPDASDAAKLAYKLLAQTGRLDNPIDRSLVETNRLVDKNGLINQKAFYYYLTAWVMNDAFTYSNSEANFRPEPKTWNENAEDLRIERARPLNYAQMPFLLKLPEDGDGLKTITELRSISQAFTQLGLPNFPTGVPFIFWDQFMNLDLLFICTFTMLTITYISIAYLVMANLNLSLILIVPSLVAVAELYSLLGLFSFQFNTIVAVILISSIATSTIQTTQCIMNFQNETGKNLAERINRVFCQEFKTIAANLTLLMFSACIFMNSKIDFMIKYSNVFFCLTVMNCFNSLVLTPVLLVLFAPSRESSGVEQDESSWPPPSVVTKSPSGNRDISRIVKAYSDKMQVQSKRDKKRSFTRVQSEISLSTISEEP